ncbi:MAG: zinc ribbon domain-containing protein [Chloroflexi bacterium]|nr:zinc ribbon domain-containing protein [Chloroflexota bacterium]
MSTAIGIIIVVVAFAFVFWPMFRTSADGEMQAEPTEDTRLGELRQERERLFATISELDSDYEMGNLSQKDHNELRRRYEEKAVSAIKQLDELAEATDGEEPDSNIGDAIEQKVKKLRSSRTSAASTAAVTCDACGGELKPGSKFCAHCGTATARFCANCGAKRAPNAIFCGQCGTRLDGKRTE